MKRAPAPFHDLDYRAARRLMEAGYTTRDQVLKAMISGRLVTYGAGSPRQFGIILYDKVRAWLGLPEVDHRRLHPEGNHSRPARPAPDDSEADLYGKVAAFRCPKCRQVFAVSQIHNRYGRPCPRCKMSVGHIEGDGRKRQAWIEW